MRRFKSILYKLRYRLRPGSAVTIAREIGVRFTEEKGKEACRILSEPLAVFGSEPYLITLGKHVEITAGVRFITHDGAFWCLRQQEAYKNLDYIAPITVGSNVFFGNDAIVLPGVTIGDNVIVGAGSVVTRDIPSNSVCAGSPARVIKTLDAYANKAKSEYAFESKGLSPAEKRAFLEEQRPQWFV